MEAGLFGSNPRRSNPSLNFRSSTSALTVDTIKRIPIRRSSAWTPAILWAAASSRRSKQSAGTSRSLTSSTPKESLRRPAPLASAPSTAIGRRAGNCSGTYDEAWQKSRFPLLPEDWDPRSLLCSPADQRPENHLRGGELVELENLTPDGKLRFALPKVYLRFRTRIDKRTEEHRARLATVIIEPDHPRVIMVWQSSLAVRTNGDYLDETIVQRETVHLMASSQSVSLPLALGRPWVCRLRLPRPPCGPGSVALGEHPFMVDGVGDLMPGALDAQLDPCHHGSGATASSGRNRAARGAARRSAPHGCLDYGCPCIWACPNSDPDSPSKTPRRSGPGWQRFDGLPDRTFREVNDFHRRACGRTVGPRNGH